jgi:hypothetical protein
MRKQVKVDGTGMSKLGAFVPREPCIAENVG